MTHHKIETVFARARRRLRATMLAVACLVIPQVAGIAQVESERGEIRVENEILVAADQSAPEVRDRGRTVYRPSEPRCRTTFLRPTAGKTAAGHTLPSGQRAPLRC
jgi:hypothetical protein